MIKLSEGELKRQILDKALELSHGDMATGAKGDDYDYIRLGELWTILDGIRKEFPEDELGKGETKLKQWFLKVFGAST